MIAENDKVIHDVKANSKGINTDIGFSTADTSTLKLFEIDISTTQVIISAMPIRCL